MRFLPFLRLPFRKGNGHDEEVDREVRESQQERQQVDTHMRRIRLEHDLRRRRG